MYIRSCIDSKLRLILHILMYAVCADAYGAPHQGNIFTVSNNSESKNNIVLNINEIENFEIRISMFNMGRVKWYKKLPLALDYDNTQACDNSIKCIQTIKYQYVEIKEFKNRRQVKLLELLKSRKLGTHLFVLTSSKEDIAFSVHVRRDNSYTGYLTELIGVPFVYAPRFKAGVGHQTDLREGADCVATVIYGMRRMGVSIPYFAPSRLYDYTKLVGHSNNLSGVKIREGDILHFGFQTAVISRDTEPMHVLDSSDLVIHSYHEFVEEVPLSSLPYKNSKFDVLRWSNSNIML